MFLFSCGNLCVASQNWFNFSTNESLSQIPQEEATASLQLPRSPQTTDHQSNRTEQSHPVRSPVSYRLRSYQLRNPAIVEQKPARPLVEQMQTFRNPQSPETRKLTSEQLEPMETALAQKLLKLPVKGPDLNPPVTQESKVPSYLYDFYAAFLIYPPNTLSVNECE